MLRKEEKITSYDCFYMIGRRRQRDTRCPKSQDEAGVGRTGMCAERMGSKLVQGQQGRLPGLGRVRCGVERTPN